MQALAGGWVDVDPRPPADRISQRAYLWTAALSVLARLPTISAPMGNDEAGYLLVARHARSGGPFSYGSLWVDRPPLLVGLFRAAADLGGLPALRVLGLVAAVVLTAAAVDVGVSLGGSRGGVWAGVTAAALQASPRLGAPEVNGELLGVPLVLLGIALGLRALPRAQRPAGSCARLAAAGAVASCALLVKQNLADGVVLLEVLVVLLAVRRQVTARRAVALIGAVSLGTVAPLMLAALSSPWWGAGPAQLWQDVVAFRAAALPVLASARDAEASARQSELVRSAFLCGGVPVLVCLLARVVRGPLGQPPAALAVVAMAAYGGFSIFVSAGGWAHYLVELVPAVAAAVALLASAPAFGQALWTTAVVAVPALSFLLSAALGIHKTSPLSCEAHAAPAGAVQRFLAQQSQPSDGVVTLYGGMHVLGDTRLRLPYPYLWSLPVRTLDPDLQRLQTVLSGSARVDWVVLTQPLHSWGLDRDGKVEHALQDGYQPAARFCGLQVLHRLG